MKRNQKGSALLWAITVIMVLMITVAAALGISYSYYNRSVQNNNRRQAYLTAKGVIQNIVELSLIHISFETDCVTCINFMKNPFL